jgi:hypothetical protein
VPGQQAAVPVADRLGQGPAQVNRPTGGSANSTPSWESASSGWSSAAKAHAAGACVCTTQPTSGRASITSVWMGYSMCRGPFPARTSPAGETSATRSAVTSPNDQPAAFIQTPRPPGSRTEACPHTMSDWPLAARA